MAGFFSALKRLFGGAVNESKAALHQRYCLSCRKIASGTLTPKDDSPRQAMDFTCSSCGGHSQVLQ
ncbi:MAG: hypothetical protein RDU30_10755 [Desulfovibrionaceae bacterium]|nr:hypothetical protein [Desulfovibrionaceae bacterium]